MIVIIQICENIRKVSCKSVRNTLTQQLVLKVSTDVKKTRERAIQAHLRGHVHTCCLLSSTYCTTFISQGLTGGQQTAKMVQPDGGGHTVMFWLYQQLMASNTRINR